jgi:hypothetical protein
MASPKISRLARVGLVALDTICMWCAMSIFYGLNVILAEVQQLEAIDFNPLFFVGFTNKGATLALLLGPVLMITLRALGRTQIWDYVMAAIAAMALVMLTRYATCSFGTFEQHIYYDLFEANLDYQTQCAYFSLLNFVLAVPKSITVSISFGLLQRFFQKRLFPNLQAVST